MRARMTQPLFEQDGTWFIPSEHARGPWDPNALHGGPVAALMAREMESLPLEMPMAIARFTVDILKPVPFARLRVTSAVERPGRRIQLLKASLIASDEEVCSARAWRIRTTRLSTGVEESRGAPFEGPGSGTVHIPEAETPAFHRTGVELRFVNGSFFEVGPCTVWIRLLHPVVDEETPSPLMRVLAAADFANGVAAALPWGQFIFINTDLSVHLHRAPSGEWICLDSRSDISSGGLGVSDSALFDVTGPIGRALQTLFVDELSR
jgi:hypothetical protein